MPKLNLDWHLGHHQNKAQPPAKFIPAKVPGAVQFDYARAEKLPPYWYGDNFKQYEWMEDAFWTYRALFPKPDLTAEQRLFFVSKGIDYEFDIILNGKHLFYQEGMFTPVCLDITDELRQNNEIDVLVYPAPKKPGAPRDRTQADQTCKPAVSYGWDWHPRLVPVGIWDETSLEIRNRSHIQNVMIEYELNDELDAADIKLMVDGKNLSGCFYNWTVTNDKNNPVLREKGTIAADELTVHSKIQNIELWWPHDHGRSALYYSNLKILNRTGELIEEKNSKIGFRRVKLVKNEGARDEPASFPKTRLVPPMQLEINGRKIFCKGSNWVNPEIFPGQITRDTYKTLLTRAVEANFNLLRCWGGAIVNKDAFFELCDEKGLMVWQDFPLACNEYAANPKYLGVLQQESESIIKRVKQHACHVIWCGGNELFNSWSGMTDQSLALRLLNAQCYRLDPQKPFIYTSPVMGVGHGHYVFRDDKNGGEVFQWMPKSRHTAYAEFGMPGPASVEELKTFIPPEELFPPKPGTAWEAHHAFNAWEGNTWLTPEIVEHYFGPAASLEELVEQGQLLQAEGYKCIYEEARRQKPYCSMALNWCYNEPWPTAANNSLLNWPAKPKPAFYAVSKACRPVLASARLPKFSWVEGEKFTCEPWILNDSPEPVAGGKMIVKLVSGKTEQVILNMDFDDLPADTNLAGPQISYVLPRLEQNRFQVVLEIKDRQELSSSYTLLYRKK